MCELLAAATTRSEKCDPRPPFRYDNQRSRVTYEDKCMQILPGLAHISHIPFAYQHPWGSAWRRCRQFVGRVDYSITHMLWTPSKHRNFPPEFKRLVITLLMTRSRGTSPLSRVPEDVIFHLINMIPCDWVPPPPPPPTASEITAEATRRVAGRMTSVVRKFVARLFRLRLPVSDSTESRSEAAHDA